MICKVGEALIPAVQMMNFDGLTVQIICGNLWGYGNNYSTTGGSTMIKKNNNKLPDRQTTNFLLSHFEAL